MKPGKVTSRIFNPINARLTSGRKTASEFRKTVSLGLENRNFFPVSIKAAYKETYSGFGNFLSLTLLKGDSKSFLSFLDKTQFLLKNIFSKEAQAKAERTRKVLGLQESAGFFAFAMSEREQIEPVEVLKTDIDSLEVKIGKAKELVKTLQKGIEQRLSGMSGLERDLILEEDVEVNKATDQIHRLEEAILRMESLVSEKKQRISEIKTNAVQFEEKRAEVENLFSRINTAKGLEKLEEPKIDDSLYYHNNKEVQEKSRELYQLIEKWRAARNEAVRLANDLEFDLIPITQMDNKAMIEDYFKEHFMEVSEQIAKTPQLNALQKSMIKQTLECEKLSEQIKQKQNEIEEILKPENRLSALGKKISTANTTFMQLFSADRITQGQLNFIQQKLKTLQKQLEAAGSRLAVNRDEAIQMIDAVEGEINITEGQKSTPIIIPHQSDPAHTPSGAQGMFPLGLGAGTAALPFGMKLPEEQGRLGDTVKPAYLQPPQEAAFELSDPGKTKPPKASDKNAGEASMQAADALADKGAGLMFEGPPPEVPVATDKTKVVEKPVPQVSATDFAGILDFMGETNPDAAAPKIMEALEIMKRAQKLTGRLELQEVIEELNKLSNLKNDRDRLISALNNQADVFNQILALASTAGIDIKEAIKAVGGKFENHVADKDVAKVIEAQDPFQEKGTPISGMGPEQWGKSFQMEVVPEEAAEKKQDKKTITPEDSDPETSFNLPPDFTFTEKPAPEGEEGNGGNGGEGKGQG